MTHQLSFTHAEFAAKRKTTRRETFLARMEQVIPWTQLLAVIEPFFPTGERGRPPIGRERMLRVCCLQQFARLALAARGLLLRAGTLVDATLIAAPPSTKHQAKQRDPARPQTKNGNPWYFGMKAHPGADGDSKLVHTVVVTAANVADVTKTVEQAKAAVRAFVEHPFHIVKNLFGYRKVKCRGLAKNGHQLYMLLGLANVVIGARVRAAA